MKTIVITLMSRFFSVVLCSLLVSCSEKPQLMKKATFSRVLSRKTAQLVDSHVFNRELDKWWLEHSSQSSSAEMLVMEAQRDRLARLIEQHKQVLLENGYPSSFAPNFIHNCAFGIATPNRIDIIIGGIEPIIAFIPEKESEKDVFAGTFFFCDPGLFVIANISFLNFQY